MRPALGFSRVQTYRLLVLLALKYPGLVGAVLDRMGSSFAVSVLNAAGRNWNPSAPANSLRCKVVIKDESGVASVVPVGKAVAECGADKFIAWLAEAAPGTQQCVLASAGREARRRLDKLVTKLLEELARVAKVRALRARAIAKKRAGRRAESVALLVEAREYMRR